MRKSPVRASFLLAMAALLVASCSSTQELAAQRTVAEPPPIDAGVAPPAGVYAPGFDALHYDIDVTLPDTGSFLEGTMRGTFRRIPPHRDTLSLDFTGLAVLDVRVGDRVVTFRHERGKLHVPVGGSDTVSVQIRYAGHPDDGLILARNIHGEPTAFADNWPNRARFWFPSIDHPGDKATVRFLIRMNPETGRRVIANGIRVDSENDDGIWEWASSAPIPTYTMVVGVANFIVTRLGEACVDVCTEVTTWLFPQDLEQGGGSFRRAVDMVRFYSQLIGPFPYEKLAHVQSATRFGGMENATAIFYPEEPISEGADFEITVAHETVHQWFGDAVTESDWHHLWLSEGFASYFAALYFEEVDGIGALREIMQGYLDGYVESGAWQEPVVNPDQEDLFRLLNANNYSKGAWILHMLRHQLGEETFFDGIRAYYEAHRHGTALTSDLRQALEAASGRPLDTFFRQWVHSPGHPRLEVSWEPSGTGVALRVRQVQPAAWPTFVFPLEIEFETENGSIVRTLDVTARDETFRVALPSPPVNAVVDSRHVLLKEIISAP